MKKLKKIPIGVDNFKEIIEGDYYYIDKTEMIKEVLDLGNKATLITRPRRFGKTLNMSMLKYFFEDATETNGVKDYYRYLFNDLKISQDSSMHEQGRYPVIALSFKECKRNTWENTYEALISTIQDELDRHDYVLESHNVKLRDKKLFERLLDGEATSTEYIKSLLLLSKMLKQYHNQPCIILLDEYDVPLQNAHVEDFYNEAIDFIRNFFSATFKQNDYMKFAIITGCLRISRESIFTGWNNVKVQSIVGEKYLNSFGITVDEKEKLLEDYDLINEESLIQEWYDGYNFNGVEIYNPWDLLNYVDDKQANIKAKPKSYWINTSSNDILQELLENGTDNIKHAIEELVQGKEVQKRISESLNYNSLQVEDVWSILLFTGYLTGSKENDVYILRIPNNSIKQCYIDQIKDYIEREFKHRFADELEKCLIEDNGEQVENLLNDFMNSTLSYYDNLEAFYHGLVTGICSNFPHYKAESNKEAGTGRADIILRPAINEMLPGIILEFKWKKEDTELENSAQEAYNQIDDRQYYRIFGISTKKVIRKFGIAFSGKTCKVIWKNVDHQES